jgi:ankyrin repeat protein
VLLDRNSDSGTILHGMSSIAKSVLQQDPTIPSYLPSKPKPKAEGAERDTENHVSTSGIEGMNKPLPPEPDSKEDIEAGDKRSSEGETLREDFRLSGSSTIPTLDEEEIKEPEKTPHTDSLKPKPLSKRFRELHKTIKEGIRNGNMIAVKASLEEAVDTNCIPLSELESGDISFLGEAIKVGFIPMINLLLEYGVDMESIAVYSVGYTALHWATSRNQINVVRILLHEGIDITKRAASNETALFIACRKGLLEIVKLLLDSKGVSVVETADGKDRTPLQTAALQGYSAIVSMLLKAGANVHSLDQRGYTALHIAAENGHVETARSLIKHHAIIDARDLKNKIPLHLATSGGHVAIIELLMEYGTELDAFDSSKTTPLHLAARNGHKDAAELLIEYGANLEAKDEYEWTPLHFATYNKRHELINLLLSSGAQVNSKSNTGKTPLMRAAELDDCLSITALCKHGADTTLINNTSGFSAIHFAAQEGSLNALETLISLNANIEQETANESTPLIIASWRGRLEIIKRLLEANVEVNHQRSHNITALHDAASAGHASVCKILLSHGSEVDTRDADNETPLMVAASKNQPAVLKTLLEAGASVDAKDNNTHSALYSAAMNGHVEIVEALLDAGVSINIVTKFNVTALHVAAFKGHVDVVELLLKRGAERGVVAKHKHMKGTPAEVAVQKSVREIIKSFQSEPLIRSFVADDRGRAWSAENTPKSSDGLEQVAGAWIEGFNVDVTGG